MEGFKGVKNPVKVIPGAKIINAAAETREHEQRQRGVEQKIRAPIIEFEPRNLCHLTL